MVAIEIRSGTEDERDWAAGLMAKTEPWITLGRGLDACLKTTHNPDFLFIVGCVRGMPLGFVLLHPRGVAGSPYIASIAVAEGARGSGIGRSLLEHVEGQFRSRARHIFLCVSSFNTRARALYERVGYRAVGDLEDYIIEGASETLMHKRLVQS